MGATCHSIRLVDQEIGRELDPLLFAALSREPRISIFGAAQGIAPAMGLFSAVPSLSVRLPRSHFSCFVAYTPLPLLLTGDPPFTYQHSLIAYGFMACPPLRLHLVFFLFPLPLAVPPYSRLFLLSHFRINSNIYINVSYVQKHSNILAPRPHMA